VPSIAELYDAAPWPLFVLAGYVAWEFLLIAGSLLFLIWSALFGPPRWFKTLARSLEV